MAEGSVDIFDNDDAADFLADLEERPPGERRQRLVDAMSQVLDNSAYVEAPGLNEALAAAAVVTAAIAPQVADGVVGAPDWLGADAITLDEQLERLAGDVLNRAVLPDQNELWELAEEAGTVDDFRSEVARWRSALRQ